MASFSGPISYWDHFCGVAPLDFNFCERVDERIATDLMVAVCKTIGDAYGRQEYNFRLYNREIHVKLYRETPTSCIKIVQVQVDELKTRSSKQEEFKLPPFYRPQASLEWCRNLQSLLNPLPNWHWLDSLQENELGEALADPTLPLSTFKEKLPVYSIRGVPLKNSTLSKLVGWIIFIHKWVELKDIPTQVDLIQRWNVGQALNDSVQLLLQIPKATADGLFSSLAGELTRMATQIIEVMSHHFHRTQGKKPLKGPQEGAADFLLPTTLTATLDVFQKHFTENVLVVGWDKTQRLPIFATSRRVWHIIPKEIANWRLFQEISSRSLVFPSKPIFVRLFNSPITMQFLLSTYTVYAHYSEIDKQFPQKVREDLAYFLHSLLEIRPDVKYRMAMLSILYNWFPTVLVEEKWEALLHLIKKEKISLQDVLDIVSKGLFLKSETLAMTVCTYMCGEGKVALQCCRYLPPEEERSAPLAERVLFSAFYPKLFPSIPLQSSNASDFQVSICSRCKDIWPAFETLYWSLNQSKINMLLVEKLDQRIQSEHYNQQKILPNY